LNDFERLRSAVSPPDSAISATNAVVTSVSAPIATSTPVNLAAGPLSPPPLSLAAGQGPHHEHPPGAAPAVKITSYPAVLKGRSAASPPNPNLVPSGKVPPPVPPRGTGSSRTGRSSEDHRGPAGAAASTASSATSSRGDEAAIITRYRLHDSSCNLHRLLPPDHSSISTSTITAKTMTSITAATSTKATNASVLHARTSTPNTYRVAHYGSRKAEGGWPIESAEDWRIRELDEDEEFVSVEKVEDAYFIRTSPHPFRPDRGIYRSDRSKKSIEPETGDHNSSRTDRERGSTKTDHLAKFTYFLNPSSRADLMNYKMSRKDKKHSETYYERMKRRQKNLEESITTITTISHRHKLMGDAEPTIMSSHVKNKSAEESVKQKISKFASIKKDSTLLRKLREKSRRKKRLAPKPSAKKQTSESFNGNLHENEKTKTLKKDKKLSLRINSQENKSGDYQAYRAKRDKNIKDFKTERKQSTMECDETFRKQDRSLKYKNSNYLGEKKNIFMNINDEQGNKKGGFKGLFPKDYRVEDDDVEDKIVRERIDKFNGQNNKRLQKNDEYKNDPLKFDQSKSRDEHSLFHEKRSLHENIKKDNLKDMNRDKFLNTTKREIFMSSSLDNIRNGIKDATETSVSEKVKSFEKIKANAKDETKDALREDVHLYNLDYKDGFNAIKEKLAMLDNETRLNKKEERLKLKAEMLNTGDKHERQTFKSLSSGHCNDLKSSKPQEFEMLAPNISFLHTYRKTRSFT